MNKKETPEHTKFIERTEELIKANKALTEEQIEELTIMYSDYLKSYGEFVRSMHAKLDFKLALIFATKIMIGK